MFTQELFSLPEGAEVEVETSPSGFFTLRWLPDFAKDLWLVSSGTGLGPFISMLRTPGALQRFEHVVVVNCVRQRAQLAYRAELEAFARGDSRVRYVPVVTREAGFGDESGRLLFGRLPSQVSSGRLEDQAGLPLSLERGHIMLCGNPEMIRDTSAALTDRGLRRHLKRAPGHITTEKYW
jgi:ferredoxin--NADP+ reductase